MHVLHSGHTTEQAPTLAESAASEAPVSKGSVSDGSVSDAVLVARVLDGDTEAYTVLVARHRDRGVRYAYRMLGDHDDAEDVVQHTLVRAYRSLRNCRDGERFGSWLFQILVNRCRTAHLRRTRRERWLVRGGTVAQEDVNDMAGESNQMDAELSRILARHDVDRVLQELPLQYREALLLHYLEELTYDEMAALADASASAMKMRVSRACEMVRQQFPHEGGGSHVGRF